MIHGPTTNSFDDGFVLLGEAEVPPQEPAVPTAAPADLELLSDPAFGDEEIEVPEHVLRLDLLFTELAPIAPEQIVLTLAGSAAARLAGRAAYLGMLPATLAAELAQERNWQALLDGGLSVAQLALLVQSEPWLPAVCHGTQFCRWLVSQAVVTQEQLEQLFERSIELGWPIFQVALEQEVLDERCYTEQLSAFSGLEMASAPVRIPRELLVRFPLGWVEHFDLVPLEFAGGAFEVAIARPLPKLLRERVSADAGAPVEFVLAPPAAVASWRRRWLRHWWKVHHPGGPSFPQS